MNPDAPLLPLPILQPLVERGVIAGAVALAADRHGVRGV